MNFILGQFYPTNSYIEKLDARVKIIATLIYVISIFMCNNPYTLVASVVAMVVVAIVSKLPLSLIAKGAKSMAVILIFTTIMNLFFNRDGNIILEFAFVKITDMGVYSTLRSCIRLLLVIMFSSMLTLSTKPMELTIAIEDLLSPLRFFKVPVAEFAMIMGIALRFIPTLCDEMVKIKKAQESRGANFSEGNVIERIKAFVPVIIPLFVSSFRRADELAQAMEARCYSGGNKRSRLYQPKIQKRDVLCLSISVIFVVYIIVMEYFV